MRLTFFFILLLFINFLACGQHKITFQSLQEGLSHHQIHCILKDSEGFMWFGTYDGLDKYDGTHFVIYEHNPDDSTSISYNEVNALIEDQHKNIWIGTSNGLNEYNRDKDNFSRSINFGKRDVLCVRTLFCDSHDVLWIGTSGNGLFRYDQHSRKLYDYFHSNNDPGSIGSNFITCIVSDKHKNIWFGTRFGLDMYNARKNTFLHFVHDAHDPGSLSNNDITSMALDKRGNLWIGTYGGGLNKLIGENKKYVFKHFQKSNKPGSISHNNILSLCADHKGDLWIGTENGGLNCLFNKSDKFTHFYEEDGNPEGLSSNSIWSLYEDKTSILWIGTYNKGLNILDHKFEKFELIQRNSFSTNTLVNNDVTGFAEDNRGNLWISTDGGGISCYDLKTSRFVNKVNNSTLSSKAVMSVVCDSKQNIWLGTWTGGIDRLNKYGKKIKNYRNQPGRLSRGNNIAVMYEDKEGNIWAGSFGMGLLLYNPATDRFSQVIDKSHRTHLTGTAYISDIMEDHEHNIWVGTLFGLICIKRTAEGKFSFHEFLHSFNPNSLSSFRITFIFEDSRKNLWIGTEDGLNRFNRYDSTFMAYTKKNGLPNNTINGILEDDKGNLWLSTNKGISKFSPAKGTFKNFTRKDGLNTNEFNANSCIKTSSGKFFFGGNNGMNAFYPDSIKINTYIPPVYITDLKIFNTPVKIGAKGSPLKKNIIESKKITLTYKQNSFTLEFVALNYTRSTKDQYAYRLQGFEKNWNYIGSRHMATYTNLDAGKYVFEVKGSNNDGVWNNTPRKLEITVLPPYWETEWAYLLYFLVFSAILFGFIKLLIIRAKQAQKLKLEKINREKEEELNKLKIQFFTNISHELRTPLSLILSPLEQIVSVGQVKGKLRGQLNMVFRNVEKLYGLVNELMDFTKSEESRLKMIVQMGDIVKFTREVYYLFIDEAHRRQIDYQFLTATDKVNVWFDKNKLEKILLNLISNAFKYTPDQGKILVRLGRTEVGNQAGTDSHIPMVDANEFVNISVIDNGSGISTEYLDRIFDRFFQSPEDDSRSLTGTGIGLALVKNLVELHHGRISVTSEKWKETRFTVIIPLGKDHFSENEIIAEPVGISSSHVKAAFPEKKDGAAHHKTSKNLPLILIIEDNTELREYIVSILSEKYRILEAPDGEVGYAIALDQLPDLIISDIIMPRMTGIEFCAKIKENMATSHIPVILLTSKATIEDKIEGIETGADAYITKPFNVSYLEVTIKKLIETRRKLFQRFSQEVYILPKEISDNNLDQKFLEQIVTYIDKNVSNQEITVEKLAAHLIMNRSNVYRKIKALTGQTATEFIRTVRLKMAIKYLESGKYNISEIAFKVGFESPGYFAKCFKKQFGSLPSEFLADNKPKE